MPPDWFELDLVMYLNISESVSSIEGSRNRKRRKKRKPKYQLESSTTNDGYKSSGLSELTHASSERLQNSSLKGTIEELCTNGEDKKVLKNGGSSSLPKPQRDQHSARSSANNVASKAELSVSKEVSVINGTA